MELFKILGKIFIDSDQAKKDLEDTTKKAEESHGKFSKFLGGVGKVAGAVGKAAVAGVAAGATAMTTLTLKAMNAAGELEQNMGGSVAVFGDYAKQMQDTAGKAYASMGLSASDYLATANKMGSLFKGAGFDIAEASDITAKAMQRAADVASIMGISTESAMESIAGAAKGNFTMMDNLGVAMNETNLQAYALSKGIKKSTSEMTQQEKIGLAMDMFLEKTADYAGNYAKENETLAGSLGTAKAALENFLSGAGDASSVAEALVGAGTVITNKLTELLPGLVTGLQTLMTQLMPHIPPLLQQILPVIIQGAISLVNGLVAVVPQLVQTLLPSIIMGAVELINSLVSMFPQIGSALQAVIPYLLQGVAQAGQAVIQALPSILMGIILYLTDPGNIQMFFESAIILLNGFVQAIPEIVVQLVEAAPQIILGIVQGILSASVVLWDAITGIGSTLIEKFKGIFGIGGGKSTVMEEQGTALASGVQAGIETLPEDAASTFDAMNANITKSVSDMTAQVSTDFSQIGTDINSISLDAGAGVSTSFEGMRTSVSDQLTSTNADVTSQFQNIKTTTDSQLTATATVVEDKFSTIMQTVTEKMNLISETVKNAIEEIKSAFNVDLKFRSVTVPKFTLSGKFDAEKGTVPKVEATGTTIYFAKGGIVDSATLFGMLGNRPMVAGESGPEAIAPIDTLQNYVAEAVASQNAGLVDVLNRILSAIVSMDENMGGNLKEALDGTALSVNKREFGRLVMGVI